MKNIFRASVSLLLVLILFACANDTKDLIQVQEVSPWCIIGFDSLDRTPNQRIAMLKQMGFSKYGFNKGKGDLSIMKDEFQLAKENNIEITSIFLWLNAKRDSKQAETIETMPTGLKSYRCARRNSMPGGLRPIGLLMTKSATSAPIHASATCE